MITGQENDAIPVSAKNTICQSCEEIRCLSLLQN